MASILIRFATIDGQTSRIAERIAARLVEGGHSVLLQSAGSPAQVAECDAVVVGAAIRYGHFPRILEDWVGANRVELARRPNAFFSVCLSAGGPGAKPQVAQGYLDDFRARTGWQPRTTASFAGALLYRRYNPFIRFMMRLVVGAAGGDTDTSRDHEYTDWQAVERFATEFAAQLHPARTA